MFLRIDTNALHHTNFPMCSCFNTNRYPCLYQHRFTRMYSFLIYHHTQNTWRHCTPRSKRNSASWNQFGECDSWISIWTSIFRCHWEFHLMQSISSTTMQILCFSSAVFRCGLLSFLYLIFLFPVLLRKHQSSSHHNYTTSVSYKSSSILVYYHDA